MKYQISDLSSQLFWDIDRQKMEWEKSAQTIINGVVEYGVMEDFMILFKVYSREKILDVVKNLRYLTPKTHHFLSIVFNSDPKTFRCYEQRLLNQGHWIY